MPASHAGFKHWGEHAMQRDNTRDSIFSVPFTVSQQRDMEAVDGSLGMITGVMQQNTDAAKAFSDASDMLASQTATLHALLGKFRLEATEKAVERAAEKAAA